MPRREISPRGRRGTHVQWSYGMTLSIPPMEPLRREEGWGRFESVGDRGRNGARAAARGDGAPHALPERNTPSTDGAQSSKGGIRDGTYRPSSRPRPSREKLGNESIVVMIYGRDVGRQSRLSRVWRAPERARAGAIKGGGVPRALPRLRAISVPRWKQREQESEEHVARKRARVCSRGA